MLKRTLAPLVLLVAVGSLMLAQDSGTKIVRQEEPRSYLLLGLQLSPKADGLRNLWVVSEGSDFTLFGPLLGGFEIGMFHRGFEDRMEYRFKTFFNFKFELFREGRIGAYVGTGGGLLEVLRTERLSSGLSFVAGFQGIVGVRIGPPVKDKFIIELQVLRTNETQGDTHIHLMAGARF